MKKTAIKLIVKIAIIVAAVLALATVADGVFNKFGLFKNVFKHELSIDKTANVVTQIKKISEFTTACYYEEIIIQKDKYKYSERKIYRKEAVNENVSGVKQSANSAWDKIKNTTASAVKSVRDNDDTTTKGKLRTAVKAAKDIAVASGSAAVDVAKEATPELVDLARRDDVRIDSTWVGKIVFIVKSKVRAGFDLSKISEDDITIDGDILTIKLPEVEIFDIIANPSDWEIYHREGQFEDSEIRDIQANVKEEIKKDAIEYGLLDKAVNFGKESLISLFKTFGFKEVVII